MSILNSTHKYSIVFIASLENICDTLFSNIITLVGSVTNLVLLSAIIFYCVVLGAEIYLFIPLSSQNMLNLFEINFPPPSNIKHLIFKPDSFSTILLNIFNFSKASYSSLRNANHNILAKSSIRRILYLSSLNVLVLLGPLKSMCTISNFVVVVYFAWKWTFLLLFHHTFFANHVRKFHNLRKISNYMCFTYIHNVIKFNVTTSLIP